MKQETQFITGIAVFLAIIIGSGYMTYRLMTDTPPPETVEVASVQPTDQPRPVSVFSTQPVSATTISAPPAPADPETALPEEEPAPPPSATQVSTVSMTTADVASASVEIPLPQPSHDHALTLDDLAFGFSRSGLSKEAKATLDTYAEALSDPQWSVLIQGHTDQTGAIPRNLRLGLRRADAVKEYLMGHGIPENRLHVVSLGEFQPVCSDGTPDCQSQNRRVSFSVGRREHVTIAPATPLTDQPPQQTEDVMLPVDRVPADNTPETGNNAELTDVKAALQAYEARARAENLDKPTTMELRYPGVVHSTPASGMPPEPMPTKQDFDQSSNMEGGLGQPVIQPIAEEELRDALQPMN